MHQRTAKQNRGHGDTQPRKTADKPCTGRGSFELQADCLSQQTPERRRCVNFRGCTNQIEPTSVAARIAPRRNGQTEVLQEMTAYLHSKADILAVLWEKERLRPKPPSQNQVGRRRAKSYRWQARCRSRGQHVFHAVDGRPSSGGNTRLRRQRLISGIVKKASHIKKPLIRKWIKNIMSFYVLFIKKVLYKKIVYKKKLDIRKFF